MLLYHLVFHVANSYLVFCLRSGDSERYLHFSNQIKRGRKKGVVAEQKNKDRRKQKNKKQKKKKKNENVNGK
jgi:hypothetical protein